MESQNVSNGTAKIYFRTSCKYAKIAHLPTTISSDQLYKFVTSNYDFQPNHIHLYYQGQILPITPTPTFLHPNSIIHIVKLDELAKQKITISIKMPNGTRCGRFEINSNMQIHQFIDKMLFKQWGIKFHQIFLVHLGKHLQLKKTFREEEIQNGSQVLCMYHLNPEVNIQKEKEEDYVIKVAAKDFENQQTPKSIYPKADFVIGIPEGIQTNNLQLIYDSKVMRSSSIQNMDLDPSDIIAQEDSRFQTQIIGNKTHKSENQPTQLKQKESHFSQEWNMIKPDYEEQMESVREGGKEHQVKGGDLIYSLNMDGMKGKNMMGELVSEYKERIKRRLEEGK